MIVLGWYRLEGAGGVIRVRKHLSPLTPGKALASSVLKDQITDDSKDQVTESLTESKSE